MFRNMAIKVAETMYKAFLGFLSRNTTKHSNNEGSMEKEEEKDKEKNIRNILKNMLSKAFKKGCILVARTFGFPPEMIFVVYILVIIRLYAFLQKHQ